MTGRRQRLHVLQLCRLHSRIDGVRGDSTLIVFVSCHLHVTVLTPVRPPAIIKAVKFRQFVIIKKTIYKYGQRNKLI